MAREGPQPVGSGGNGAGDAGEISTAGAGYVSNTIIRFGSPYDLPGDGGPVSPTFDEFVWSRRPPGNSYNDDHYLTGENPPFTTSDGDAEVVLAHVVMEGEIRSEITCDIEWTRPDGVTAWTGSVSIPDPSEYDYLYWKDVYFWTYIGRGFGQSGTAEVIGPGNYHVEFDTNHGTAGDRIEAVGPEVVGCSGVPNRVQSTRSFGMDVTIENNHSSRHTGDIYIANSDDLRDVFATDSFSVGSNSSTTETVNVSARDVGDVDDTVPVSAYVVTDA